jgi:hypothetical protein
MRATRSTLPRLSRAEIGRRADKYLLEIQKELLPDHAAEFVAINLDTGEYVLGQTPHEVFMAFRTRWPNRLMFRCRVDGGPVAKFHGM